MLSLPVDKKRPVFKSRMSKVALRSEGKGEGTYYEIAILQSIVVAGVIITPLLCTSGPSVLRDPLLSRSL